MECSLGDTWTGNTVAQGFYAAANKGWVADSISLLDDLDQGEKMRQCSLKGQFHFAYDGEDDANPGPAKDPNEFVKGRLVAVEIQVHLRNYRNAKSHKGPPDYSFRLRQLKRVSGTRSSKRVALGVVERLKSCGAVD